jgi:hypothetical protein
MSGGRSRFIIAGTHSMGVAFGASMSSGAPAVRSFTSWWRHGCLILPPARQWRSARRVSRYRRLSELHQLLIERGFRRSSPDDPTIVQEEQDEEPMLAESSAIPRQLNIPFNSARLRGASPSERSTVVVRLASLLLEAPGVAAGERDDDEH